MKLILTSIFLLSTTSSTIETKTIHRIPIKDIQNLTIANGIVKSPQNLIQLSCHDISNSLMKFGITEVLCNNLEVPINSTSIIDNCQLEYFIDLEQNNTPIYQRQYKLIFCIIMIVFYIVVTSTACYQIKYISNNFDTGSSINNMSRIHRGYSPTRSYKARLVNKDK